MSKGSRNGQRLSRSERTNRRNPELGYYLIVTDTEGTERVYFNGLRDSIKPQIGDKLIIKVVETKIEISLKKQKISYLNYHNMLNLGLYLTEIKSKTLIALSKML